MINNTKILHSGKIISDFVYQVSCYYSMNFWTVFFIFAKIRNKKDEDVFVLLNTDLKTVAERNLNFCLACNLI